MITIGLEGPDIVASIQCNYGDEKEFKACITALRTAKFTYNAKNKDWRMKVAMYKAGTFDILRLMTEVYVPTNLIPTINNFYNTMPSDLIEFEPIKEIDYSSISNFQPFKGKKPYENYQDEDIKKALSQNRFLFNWEMGLGKSFATAIIYGWLRANRGVDKMILFTSKIGTYNLAKEMVKFYKGINLEDIYVFAGAKSFNEFKKTLPRGEAKKKYRRIFDHESICNKKILVFNYDAWKLVSNEYGDTARKKGHIPLDNFFQGTVPLVCLDECHKLSNPQSDRGKAVLSYMRYFQYRYLFSATPADKPEKLYSVGFLLDPKLIWFLRYNEWINKYNDVGTYFSKFAINKKKWHMDELDVLNQQLSKYSAKRLAEDCLDLPGRRMMPPFMIDMDPEQDKLYKMLVNYLINKAIQEGADEYGIADVIRDSFGTIQNFLENPHVTGNALSDTISQEIKDACANYNYSKSFAKLEVVDDIIEEEMENEKRGIIWYIHPDTLECLRERYAKLNPVVVEAGLSDAERDKLIDEFKYKDSHKILIASINIMNTSVTVTEATFAIYLENTYSYENYFQSLGRIHRIGQKEVTRFYHMYYQNTINVFSQVALNNKKDLVDTLFDGERRSLNLQQAKSIFLGEID